MRFATFGLISNSTSSTKNELQNINLTNHNRHKTQFFLQQFSIDNGWRAFNCYVSPGNDIKTVPRQHILKWQASLVNVVYFINTHCFHREKEYTTFLPSASIVKRREIHSRLIRLVEKIVSIMLKF